MAYRLAVMTLGLAVILGGRPASADYKIYKNRATFESAMTGETTETFNELGPMTQSFSSGPLGTSSGLVTPITVSSSNGYILSASSTSLAGYYPADGTYLLGPISTSTGDGLTVTFPTNTYSAVGLNVGAFLSNSIVSYLVKTSDGVTISGQVAVDNASPASSLAFIGVVLGKPGDFVTSITLSTPVGLAQNILIDNVSEGFAPLSVPEPTSMVLIAVGGFALAVTNIRRQRIGKPVA